MKTIKYTGAEKNWDELSVTGKQSVWYSGWTDAREDAEADLLIATGFFTQVKPDSPEALNVRVSALEAAGPGGGGIADGDKGDVVVSGSGTVWTIGNAVAGGAAGLMTGADKTKLNGIAAAATANSADATLLARANHTGTQSIATVLAAATARFFGRITASGGAGEELTGTQATTLLDTFTTALKGLAPASGGGTTNFLRADGTWATPAGGGDVTLTGTQTLTNKTLTGAVIGGVTTYSGASNLAEASLGDFIAHTADGPQLTSTMTTGATLTFDATPSDGRVFGPVRVPANSGGPYTLTIPSSVNASTGATITTVSVPASGQVELTFRRIGAVNYVYGIPATGVSTALADITDMSANARTFNAAADYSAMRTAIGLVIGTNVQAYSAVLTTLAGASANGQSLVTAANYSAMRTALTLVPGTDVQAYDADLAAIAGLTATTDNFIQAKSSAWASRTVAQVAADLNGTGLVATNLALRHIPQNSQSTAYTAVAADAGGHILHPTADNNARTFTIPANSSVAYPVGAAITFVNLINTVTIAITTDTLILAGAGTTGSRTLAANGVATAIKITSTSWIISGTGLT